MVMLALSLVDPCLRHRVGGVHITATVYVSHEKRMGMHGVSSCVHAQMELSVVMREVARA
jgi:hypothetical protein